MISEKVIEGLRIIDTPEAKEHQAFEAYCNGIAQKLFPDVMARHSVVFRLMNTDEINACVASEENPPVVGITKGLLQFVKNEDELVYVIGHEIAHKFLRDKFGIQGRATKLEEGGADVEAIFRMGEVGYNYKASYEFLKRLSARYARRESNLLTVC